jgi:hypothetical protein
LDGLAALDISPLIVPIQHPLGFEAAAGGTAAPPPSTTFGILARRSSRYLVKTLSDPVRLARGAPSLRGLKLIPLQPRFAPKRPVRRRRPAFETDSRGGSGWRWSPRCCGRPEGGTERWAEAWRSCDPGRARPRRPSLRRIGRGGRGRRHLPSPAARKFIESHGRAQVHAVTRRAQVHREPRPRASSCRHPPRTSSCRHPPRASS